MTFPDFAKERQAAKFDRSLTQVAQILGSNITLVSVQPSDAAVPESLRSTGSTAPMGGQAPDRFIGVRCGPASGNLAAIIFRGDGAYKEFLAANPDLQRTLRTWWPQACRIIWFRPADFVPKNWSFDTLAWISEGVIPVASPDLLADHFILAGAPVLNFPLAKIQWPQPAQGLFEVLCWEHTFGPRYRRLGPRKVVLNFSFWAQFAKERIGLFYHVQQHQFHGPRPDDPGSEKYSLDKVINLLVAVLQEAARADSQFPASELRLPRIKALVEEIKVANAVNTPGEKDGLNAFLEARLERRAESDVTVAELWQDYVEFCRTGKLPTFPRSIFERLLPSLIRQTFGLAKSHDVKRPGSDSSLHAQRGFHGLGLKVKTKTDGADVADGPDGQQQKPGPTALAQAMSPLIGAQSETMAQMGV